MNFSLDRDLLSIEPEVFNEVPLVGQQRLHVTDAVLSGTTLTSIDADFTAAQIDAGSVVLIDSTPLEVIERVDAGTLTVSLLRAKLDDTAIPPHELEGTDLILRGRTFEPQAAMVHDSLLRLLGIDPDATEPDALDEDAVVSLTLMSKLEAFGTLDLVYGSATSLEPEATVLKGKAEHYRGEFHQAIRGATVLLDTNGDGLAEEKRHLGVIRLARA